MDAQTITNLLTAGLGVATVWLALETRRMAVAAKAAVDLESQALLAIRGIDLKLAPLLAIGTGGATPGIRVGLRLANPGKVLVTYDVTSIVSSLFKVDSAELGLNTTGGVVFPGEETLFLLPFAPVNADSTVMHSGTLGVDIAFWSTPDRPNRVAAQIKYEILRVDPLDWQWVYLAGPTYTLGSASTPASPN